MRILALVIGLCVFLADLFTKQLIKNSPWLHNYTVIEDFVTLQYVRNEGIAFGLLHGVESVWKPILLSCIAAVAVGIVLYYILKLPRESYLSFASLGLLLGGILGNFVDRLLHHHVVDFVTLHWRDAFVWPTFNVADAAITTGVVLILWQSLFSQPVAERSFSSIVALPLLMTPSPVVVSPQEVVQQLQQKYEGIETLQANFQQTLRQTYGEDRTESGILLLKKPGLMYWEYQNPTQKYFVADGKKTYFYVPRDKQVMIWDMRLEDTRSPLMFLLGEGDIARDFEAHYEETEDPLVEGHLLLRLTPREPHPDFSYLILEVDPASHLIYRLSVIEPVGQRNDYILTNIQQNVTIPDQRFHVDVPSGVEIIQQ
ncbi:MAG TPA: signal peptidase II [Acidobacteriota bacterium]|nr:signal peptidase II [Acidobacteriota bacterium]